MAGLDGSVTDTDGVVSDDAHDTAESVESMTETIRWHRVRGVGRMPHCGTFPRRELPRLPAPIRYDRTHVRPYVASRLGY